ncbi:MAG: hypothetical protein EBV69_07930 [Oxalobacteraceae bacterium]|nr:hypothetical protein [Oxalobacteraceae bacterium]NDG08406.1 hypothetical protein [Oxalobacteraceae bacterium]
MQLGQCQLTNERVDEGRLALIEQVKVSIAVHPALEVRIFLDSPRSGVEQVNEQLSLHYSGGTGANRADHDLAGYLAYLRKQNDSLPTTVISTDLAVQQNAHRIRPIVCGPMKRLERLLNH